MGSVGLGLSLGGLAACATDPPAQPAQGASGTPGADLEDGPLVIFNWAQYLSDANVEAFTNEFDREVQVEIFGNADEMLNVVRSGGSGYDLVVPGDPQIPVMVEEDLLLQIDKSKIPNLSNVYDRFLGQPWDPNNDYTVPKDWGTNGFLYRSDVVNGDFATWDDFVTLVKENSGKTVFVDSPIDIFGAALKATGHSVSDSSEAALGDAREWLLDLKPHLLAILPFGETRPIVLSGDAVLSLTSPADAALLRSQDELDVEFVYPSEGTVQFVDNWAIPKSAPNPNLAHAFINFIHGPERAAEEVEYILYGSVNEAAIEEGLVDEAVIEVLTPPDDVVDALEFQDPPDADARRRRDEIWTEFKAS